MSRFGQEEVLQKLEKDKTTSNLNEKLKTLSLCFNIVVFIVHFFLTMIYPFSHCPKTMNEN